MIRYLLHVPLLLALLAPAAAASDLESSRAFNFGCDVYGNQIKIGSIYECNGGDCTNYGNQVYVGSTFNCQGDCTNYGNRVTIGSSYCGDDANQACVGDLCVGDDLIPAILRQRQAMSFADCIPRAELGPETLPTIQLVCDESGGPCGVNQQPVCWAVRNLCMNYLIAVFNVYEHQVEDLVPEVRENGSRCEGQPGWPPQSSTQSAAFQLALASGCGNYGTNAGVWLGHTSCIFTYCVRGIGVGIGFGADPYGGLGAGATAGTAC